LLNSPFYSAWSYDPLATFLERNAERRAKWIDLEHLVKENHLGVGMPTEAQTTDPSEGGTLSQTALLPPRSQTRKESEVS